MTFKAVTPLLCTLLPAVLLAACATAPVATRQVPVDSEFSSLTTNWSLRDTAHPGGTTVIVAKIVDVDGVMDLCGAWTHTGGSGAASALRDLVARVNGTPVQKDLSYFAAYRSRRALDRGAASCASTGIATPKGAITLRLESTAALR